MQDYPISHKRDNWNPPPWVFCPAFKLCLYPIQAAKILGMSANSLKKYTDALGLTVYRNRRNKARLYDREEIEEIRKAMDEGRLKKLLAENGYGERQGKRTRRRAV